MKGTADDALYVTLESLLAAVSDMMEWGRVLLSPLCSSPPRFLRSNLGLGATSGELMACHPHTISM